MRRHRAGEMVGIDVELEVTGSRGGYGVSARSSAGGEASAVLRVPFDDQALRERLLEIEVALAKSSARVRGRVLSSDERRVRAFGRELFDALFAGDVRSLFDSSRNRAAQDDDQLRLVLRIQPPELERLPWEFLYDPRRADYLALSASLVRYAEVMEPAKPLTVAPPLRVLGMVAGPADLEPLGAEQERSHLSRALERLEEAGRVRVDWVAGQTWGDLQAALHEQPWHVLHFIGHGGFAPTIGEGFVAFAGEGHGAAARLGASKLGQLLRTCPSLRLVVLNTCDSGRASADDRFSSSAAVLTRTGIPAVAAMQFRISDQAAIRFASAFYQAVAAGRTVDVAVTAGRLAINLATDDTLEWGTPVLYLRSPDARLFDLGALPPASGQPERVRPTPATGPRPIASAPAALRTCRHPAAVHAIAFSPDGRWLATTSDDCTARIWDAETGRELVVVRHDQWVRSVVFNLDGRRLATGSADHTARVWDAATGEQVASIEHDDLVNGVAYSPDGRWLATACDDGAARFWDAEARGR